MTGFLLLSSSGWHRILEIILVDTFLDWLAGCPHLLQQCWYQSNHQPEHSWRCVPVPFTSSVLLNLIWTDFDIYLEHLVPLPLLDIIICPFLDYYILSIFHDLGSPLSYHTLIFDLMSSSNMYLYNAYIYSILITWANQRCCVDRLSPKLFITK